MAEIKWHDSAREHLRKIFNFNINHFSESYAYSILGEVLGEVQDLENFPKKGAPELLHFLVDDEAHIAAVWDVRRDPKTLIQLVVDGEK